MKKICSEDCEKVDSKLFSDFNTFLTIPATVFLCAKFNLFLLYFSTFDNKINIIDEKYFYHNNRIFLQICSVSAHIKNRTQFSINANYLFNAKPVIRISMNFRKIIQGFTFKLDFCVIDSAVMI